MKSARFVAALVILPLIAFGALFLKQRAALGPLRELVGNELGVDVQVLKIKRIDLNDLGDHCAFFRIDGPPATTLALLGNTEKFFDRQSMNPLKAYLPFAASAENMMADVAWWTLPSKRDHCREWVANWQNKYRVNLILCDKTLFGYLENTFERRATPGPL